MLERHEHGPLLELRLARPPVNALSPDLIAALRDAVEEGGRQAEALVLSGAPGIFSAGLDVPLLAGLGRAAMAEVVRDFFALMRALAAAPVPVAAAITGHSPAGGAVLALFSERLAVAGRMIPASEALAVGFVDELAPADEVIPRAVAWCQSLLALPRGPMLRTRDLFRSRVIEGFDALAESAHDRFLDDWFSAETQAAVAALVARLQKKT